MNFPTLELYLLCHLVRLHRAISGNGSLVRDKLINAEEIEHYSRHRGRYSVYWLHFSGYGSYKIPAENYTWSNTYSMSAMGVYHYALSGDEFYLVLSKPHTGKILMAYNCKLFEKPEDLL